LPFDNGRQRVFRRIGCQSEDLVLNIIVNIESDENPNPIIETLKKADALKSSN